MIGNGKVACTIKHVCFARRYAMTSKNHVMFAISLMCIALLLIFTTPTLLAEVSVRYTFVFNLLDWVVKTELDVPKVFEEGTVVTIITSFTVMEKGRGVQLTLTNFEVKLGNAAVSTYVGSFTYVNQVVRLPLTIPVSGVGEVGVPGSAVTATITIRLQGYVMDVDGSREDVSFTYSVPIIVQTPIAAPLVSLDTAERDGRPLLFITLRNYGPHEIYNVYTLLYVNGSYYAMKFVNVMKSGDYAVFVEPLKLEPGVYMITAETNYITVYGTNKVAVALRRVVIPLTPNVTIKVSPSYVTALETLFISGRVEPKGMYSVVIEASTDGVTWRALSTVKTDGLGYFTYNWKPYVTGNIYLRARSVETELCKEALSHAIVVEIKKALPTMVLSASQTVVSVGSFTKLSVSVSPSARIPVSILYREPKTNDWVLYTTVSTTEDGKAEVPTQFFARSGTYTFKAIAQETDYSYRVESNELSIVVRETKEEVQDIPVTPLPIPQSSQLAIMVFATSATVAVVLYLIGRRRIA